MVPTTTAMTELFEQAAKSMGIVGQDFTLPTEHDVIANGIRLHYMDWGGTGFPVIFLHGGGQTAHTWDMVAVQLRKQYRCIAVDQRNHGDSEKVATSSNAYNRDAMREDVHGLVQALGLRKFAVVGMSMGGMNTLFYAAKYHEGLQAAVIIDVTPTQRFGGAARIVEMLQPVEYASFEAAIEASMKAAPGRDLARVRWGLVHALRQREDGKWVWKHQMGMNRPPQNGQPDEETRKRMLEIQERGWAEVGKIDCPLLVVHGSRSQVIDTEMAERLAKAVKDGEAVTIEGAGHTVQGDKPVELTAQLRRFFRKAGV